MSAELDILMSTFNGERYIEEQIDSILKQSYTSWRLVIRDDGSTDNTIGIVRDIMGRHPDKITLLEDGSENLGAAQSFFKLCEYSDARYLAFADQDDIWEESKLHLQMETVRRSEEMVQRTKPMLIHTDLSVIDESGSDISDSFWRYQHYDPSEMSSLNSLLIQNHVTGCTMLINRELLEAAQPFPGEAVMHDWWFALVAASTGRVIALGERTVRYRQHPRNEVGAKEWGFRYIFETISQGVLSMKRQLENTRTQARALLLLDSVDDESRQLIHRYIEMYDESWLKKRRTMLQNKFTKYGLVRRIAALIAI